MEYQENMDNNNKEKNDAEVATISHGNHENVEGSHRDGVHGAVTHQSYTNNALIGVVAILILMSGIQVFQTQKLLAAVSSGAIKASAQTQGGVIGAQSQVGGCG